MASWKRLDQEYSAILTRPMSQRTFCHFVAMGGGGGSIERGASSSRWGIIGDLDSYCLQLPSCCLLPKNILKGLNAVNQKEGKPQAVNKVINENNKWYY